MKKIRMYLLTLVSILLEMAELAIESGRIPLFYRGPNYVFVICCTYSELFAFDSGSG